MSARDPLARRCGPGGSTAGFLLTEALVTMVIGAFILVALASAVQMMSRAGERSAALSRDIEATSRSLAALGRDLRSTARARWAGGGFVFSGSARGMMFARVGEAGDLRLIRFAVEDGSTSRVTRVDAAFPPFARGLADIGPGAVSQLYAGRFAVRFAYARALGAGEALVDAWDLPGDMPTAVRVALLDPANGDLVSVLRIPLVIDAESGCAAPEKGLCSFVEQGQADAADLAGRLPEAAISGDPGDRDRYAQ